MKILTTIWIVLVMLGFNGCSKSMGSLEVINQSGEKIISGNIKVCNSNLNIPELQKDEKINFKFELCGDDHYRTSIRLASGNLIQQEVGYVSSVSHLVDSIFVKANSIEYKNKEVKY